MSDTFSMVCGVPIVDSKVITMAHGGGGKLTSELISKIFKPSFNNAMLSKEHDGAVLEIGGQRLAFSTDSFVVSPHFFPGGDIGKLAVFGTANDLAMCGARPLFLSCGFILEEGFATESLARIAHSMQAAAREVGLTIVTGDTKVVERGSGDGVYINTAGIGVVEAKTPIEPCSIQEGDVILLSGDVGRHGMSILSHREGLSFESELKSDCASLWASVESLLRAGIDVRCLRDLTRGGFATGLIELAESSALEFLIDEKLVEVTNEVRGACEILGLDPFYVANEGRFVAIVPPSQVEEAIAALRRVEASRGAAVVGRVSQKQTRGRVVLKSQFGSSRYLDKLSGEQLPRIC